MDGCDIRNIIKIETNEFLNKIYFKSQESSRCNATITKNNRSYRCNAPVKPGSEHCGRKHKTQLK